VAVALAVIVSIPLQAQLQQERIDLDAIYRIKEEGLQRSQIMDIASYLTDVSGPRLTNSPQLKAAAEWSRKKLIEWELSNVQFEDWGNFGRGWSNERMTAHVVSTPTFPVIAFPKAWTPGTPGAMTADVVSAVMATDADFEKFRGKLKGKIAMITAMRDVPALFQAPGRRLTDQELQNLATQPVQPPGQRGGGGGGAQNFNNRRMAFLMAEGVVATLDRGSDSFVSAGGSDLSWMTQRTDGGTVFPAGSGPRDQNAGKITPGVTLAVEHYNRMMRILEKNVPVKVELEK
jgi:hypothetical protein